MFRQDFKLRHCLLGLSPDARGEYLLYDIDIGHRWGSEAWLYSLRVRIDPSTGRVSDVWYAD